MSKRLTSSDQEVVVAATQEDCGQFDMSGFAGGWITSNVSGTYEVWNSPGERGFNRFHVDGSPAVIELVQGVDVAIPSEFFPLANVKLVGNPGMIDVFLKS